MKLWIILILLDDNTTMCLQCLVEQIIHLNSPYSSTCVEYGGTFQKNEENMARSDLNHKLCRITHTNNFPFN